MKRVLISTGLLLILAVAPGSDIFCQQDKGSGLQERTSRPAYHMNYRMLDLTEDQQARMNELRLERSETLKPLNTELQKVRIDYRSLITETEKDLDAINENIDKQTDLQNEIMKSNILFRKKMEDILTDGQKQLLNTRGPAGRGFCGKYNGFGRNYAPGFGQNHGRDYRQGFRSGMGRGYGRGFDSRNERGPW